MKKIIENLNHHLDDYECMWNGIEDIYMYKTNEKIPNQFFFAMSGFCGFAYIKTNKSDIKRMVSFGDGRTKLMYKLLAPIVGFDYKFIESKTSALALKKAKKEIDLGYPVVLGALDMYYLEYYPKLYHKNHIPFHYILMIGYDDELEKIYLYDCGKKDVITLSYSNLLLAWNAEYDGLSKANTICTIRMTNPRNKKDILKEALMYKANLYTNPPTSFLGINGIKKLADELPNWENELGKDETMKIVKNMINFFGSVPQTPNKILCINEPDEITYMCSRDKMSKVIDELSLEYKNNNFKKASELFMESGKLFENLCDIFIEYVLDGKLYDDVASKILLDIGNLEYEAYKLILIGLNEL